jgi:exosortase F-associated protein
MWKEITLKRWAAILVGFFGLVMVYVFQRHLFYDPIQDVLVAYGKHPDDFNALKFAGSKVLRYILNDGFSILIIFGLFEKKKFLKFAVGVFFFGFVVLLPIYLIFSIYFSEATYSFLNHLHRLVLNPLLMLLLIPAFYYQKQLADANTP